jgi:predicted ester cyclase
MSEQLPINTAKSLVQSFGDKNWSMIWSLVDWRIAYDEIPTRRKTHGIKRFMTIMQEWGAAFPDSKITIRDAKVFGNTVIFDLRWSGTHDGPIDTPGGTILPTGKKIDISSNMMIEVEEDKVHAITHTFDLASMEKQIELTPEERAA